MNNKTLTNQSKGLNLKAIKILLLFITTALFVAFVSFGHVQAKSYTTSKNSLISGNTVSGEKVVETARKYVNKLRYSWGGTSLTHGCDCSGFVYAVYRANGIDFKSVRSSFDMSAAKNIIGRNIGTDTSKAEAGDIIIYPNHAGLCTSQGTVIQCQNAGCREQTHAYMKRYFGGVQCIIRLDLVKNLSSGDIVKLDKQNAKYQVVKTGRTNTVKYLGQIKNKNITSKKATETTTDDSEVVQPVATVEINVVTATDTESSATVSVAATDATENTEIATTSTTETVTEATDATATATEATATTATEATGDTTSTTKQNTTKKVKTVNIPKKVKIYGVVYRVINA
ncbi:MAG: C40 family peptidase [Lachnospiraceae bacterium]|nr:C40 family peptidase [Lachnospiraceae bacterium]